MPISITRRTDDKVDVGHQLIVEHGSIPLTDADLVGLPVGVQRRSFGMIEADGPLLLSQG